MEKLNEHAERVSKEQQRLGLLLYQEYGFRIEDPEIQKRRERLADGRP